MTELILLTLGLCALIGVLGRGGDPPEDFWDGP